MKLKTLTLCLCAIGAAFLAGCREDKTVSDGYPHLATPYEEGGEGGSTGGATTTDISGGWFNVGGPPGIYLKIDTESSSFGFESLYSFRAHQANYWVDYFTNGNFTTTSSVSGSSLTWQAQSGSNTATFSGQRSGSQITGSMTTLYNSASANQSMVLVRPTSLYSTAANQVMGQSATYTLGGTQHYKVVKVTVTKQNTYLEAYTTGTGIDTWVWMLDGEGNFKAQSDGSGSTAYDSYILTPAVATDYYFIITQFGQTAHDVTFVVKERILSVNN